MLLEKCKPAIKANKNIALLGLMGSGKSYTAEALAAALGYEYIDLDEWIETYTEKSINSIFSEDGESWFRNAETFALKAVLRKSPIVLATGGGTPCFNGNLNLLLEHCTCIYLKPTLELVKNRLLTELPKRPLLNTFKNNAELGEQLFYLNEQRETFYAQSHLCVQFDSVDQPELTEKIITLLRTSDYF